MVQYIPRMKASLVLSLALLAGACAKKDDTAAADSALNKDIQLANSDTAARPALTDVPAGSSATTPSTSAPRTTTKTTPKTTTRTQKGLLRMHWHVAIKVKKGKVAAMLRSTKANSCTVSLRSGGDLWLSEAHGRNLVEIGRAHV